MNPYSARQRVEVQFSGNLPFMVLVWCWLSWWCCWWSNLSVRQQIVGVSWSFQSADCRSDCVCHHHLFSPCSVWCVWSWKDGWEVQLNWIYCHLATTAVSRWPVNDRIIVASRIMHFGNWKEQELTPNFNISHEKRFKLCVSCFRLIYDLFGPCWPALDNDDGPAGQAASRRRQQFGIFVMFFAFTDGKAHNRGKKTKKVQKLPYQSGSSLENRVIVAIPTHQAVCCVCFSMVISSQQTTSSRTDFFRVWIFIFSGEKSCSPSNVDHCALFEIKK